MLFHLDRGLVGVLGTQVASTRFRELMTMPSAARPTAIMRSMQTGYPRGLTGIRAESRCTLGTCAPSRQMGPHRPSAPPGRRRGISP
jgi:hypothetical protein